MATAEQIKALLKSHAERDDQRFYSIALQVAAKEARQGHHKLANDIKSMVEHSQMNAKSLSASTTKPTPLVQQPKGDLKGLLELTSYIFTLRRFPFGRAISFKINSLANYKSPLNQ